MRGSAVHRSPFATLGRSAVLFFALAAAALIAAACYVKATAARLAQEFTTDERWYWLGTRAVYSTVTGYEGWNIPACGQP